MWIDRYALDSATSVEGLSFHVIHKIPVGDTPYVKAKHVQLVDKDPDRAIALFWAAINAGDRVDSALKDMAIVMKQQNRPEEAIEAIKSLRDRCTDQAQEALDNVLLDLYKRCGRLNDQIALLKRKLHLIHQGLAFNGKRTKTARSQGRKFQVTIEQEASRLLGNLGWAYMQQSNYVAADAVYRKALSIEPDSNKLCNLGICLMKQGMLHDARIVLEAVSSPGLNASPSQWKTYERAQEMLCEVRDMKSVQKKSSTTVPTTSSADWSWNPLSSPGRTSLEHHLPGIMSATSGFSDDGDIEDEIQDSVAATADVLERAASATRKRSHEAENEQQQSWEFSGQQHQAQYFSRLPLTADWTNKTYGSWRSPGTSRATETTPKKSPEPRLWTDVVDDDGRSSARRSLASGFDSADDALLQDLLTGDDRDVRSDRERRSGELEEKHEDVSRSQRRLKVFEEITLH